MPKSFMDMASDAMGKVQGISPAEAQQKLQQDPNAILIDVRDLPDRRASGMAAGAIAISAGMLPIKADLELPEQFREPKLQDRARTVITICELGPMSAIGANTLKEMGFTNVSFVEGGTQGWNGAGLPTEQPTDG